MHSVTDACLYTWVTHYITVEWTISIFLLHISYTRSKRALEPWQIWWQTECHVSQDPLLLSVLSHGCESHITVRYQIYINVKCCLGVRFCGWSFPLFISRLCVFVQAVPRTFLKQLLLSLSFSQFLRHFPSLWFTHTRMWWYVGLHLGDTAASQNPKQQPAHQWAVSDASFVATTAAYAARCDEAFA